MIALRGAELAELVATARVIGERGAADPHLAHATCALVLDGLGADADIDVDALAAPVIDSRDAFDESLAATASGRSWLLSGHVSHVAYAQGATCFLTVVRSRPFAGRERGLRVYSVDYDADGLQIEAHPTIDNDRSARLVFDAVQIGEERVVGPSRDATDVIEAALDGATLVAVAEMLGAADAARRCAIERVNTRVQFGRPLATKQVVAHKVADMTMACEVVELLLADLVADVAAGQVPDPLAVSLLKIQAGIQLPAVTATAHQLHGGEGYYADQPLHGWHRRVTSLATQYGDRRAHRARATKLLQGGKPFGTT